MNFTYDEARAKLSERNQEQVLHFYDELTDAEKDVLLAQIQDLDLTTLDLLGNKNQTEEDEKVITPLPALDLDQIEAKKDIFLEKGLKALSEGKAAAVLLAGGMGTRLGFDKPKGMLPIGEKRELYLFEQLVNNIQDVNRQVQEYCEKNGLSKASAIPFYIMTSEKNDKDTREFFEGHNYFGYDKNQVHFFVQEMAAAVGFDGKVLLEEKGRLATSPNGNGGWFSSLAKAGYLDEIHQNGVEWLNIFSVDNPLQRITDPIFLGAVLDSGLQSGSKVVRKNDPYEKMGVVCKEDGKPSVIEYYELSDEMANAVDENGILSYGFGVILNYFFQVKRLEEIMNDALPVHVVEKKVPYVDENGILQKPEEPNAYKFESLAVDTIRLMDGTVPFEVIREKEFAPIKNLHGVDSLDSSRELMKQNQIEL